MSPQTPSTGSCGSGPATDFQAFPTNTSFRGNEPGAPFRLPGFEFLGHRRDGSDLLPASGTLSRKASGASLLEILDAALAIAFEEELYFSELADEFAEEENAE